jgi:hypothetical protein
MFMTTVDVPSFGTGRPLKATDLPLESSWLLKIRKSVAPMSSSSQRSPQASPNRHGGADEEYASALRGAKRRSNPVFVLRLWMASLSLSSGGHSPDLLARNDEPMRFIQSGAMISQTTPVGA